MPKDQKQDKFRNDFLQEINSFINKLQEIEANRQNSLSCDNCFKNSDFYQWVAQSSNTRFTMTNI